MRLASAWSVVFLIVIGASFFAKAGEMFSRVWLGSFYVSGLAALVASRKLLFLLVRKWTREGRLDPPHGDRRRRRGRRERHRGAAAAEGFRRQDHRPVRRSRRRAQRHGLRRRAQARHRRRSGRIRAAHARRSGDLFAADLGGRPHPADAEEIVGAAGRHPARRPHQQAAIPPALLFLHRQRAGARRVRSADRRLGRGDEMAVRQIDRRPPARPRAAGDGADRARHQARKPRSGSVQAEALRLQQRPDRGLQVPLDVCGRGRRHRQQARHQGRSARDARRALSSARPASTSCRSCSTWCSRATCRWSARARTRSTPRRKPASTTRRWTATSPATASSRASPAGRRSTAGVARPTPTKRSSSASSTISTTSRTGRCCSISTSWRRTPFALLKTENAY